MKAHASHQVIFGGILILVLLVPSCVSSVSNDQQTPNQSGENAVFLDNVTLKKKTDSLVSTGQHRICSTPNLPIPDLGTKSDPIQVQADGQVIDLDVSLKIQHTYVGDLTVMLDHIGGSGPITLIDQLGCGGSNIDVTINDEGLEGDLTSQCDDAPAIHGDRKPSGSVLSAFDGNDLTGEWVLTIIDNNRGDQGTLVEWCLISTFDVTAQSCYDLIISHTGQGSNPVASPTKSAECSAGQYISGESISLSGASPDSGWQISSWRNTDNDASTASTNTITMPASRFEVSVNYMELPLKCEVGTFTFRSNDAQSGTAGNIKTFTINGVNVNVSGWSRNKTTDVYAPAYVGEFQLGLGVTDLVSDGNGANSQHALDNSGEDNYLLFEFDRPVTVDQIYPGFIAIDGDITAWFGNAPGGVDPFKNHQTLNGAFLNELINETNFDISAMRWMDINGDNRFGNIFVISPKIGDSNDYIKVEEIEITCPR